MILDGYSRVAELHGEQFLFRPMVEHERQALLGTIRVMPEVMADRIIRNTLEEHVVYAPWGFSVFDMDDAQAAELMRIIVNAGRDEEDSDEANLARYVGLEAKYPWLAHTSCESCRAWWWNPRTGELAYQHDAPLRRPDDMELMCECSTCPKGHWSNPIEISERNRLALAHYRACEASGSFPQDEVVKRNARVIRANTG